jgi:hypothetical protein
MNLQEQKQQELLALDKNMGEHKKKEVELQNAKKSNAGQVDFNIF